VALSDGRVGLASFTDEAVRRPAVRELMAKVEAREGAEPGAFPIGGYAEVRIALRDGSEHTLRVDTPRGDPSRPLAWDELAEKFRDCAGTVLSAQAIERTVHLVERLEELPRVGGLTETLRAAPTEAQR
jgi:2-methylcitrate dehydratase PrpD